MMLITTNNFQTKLSEGYKNVRSSDDFCDVTLVSEDKMKVDAHKVILASASAVFRSILKSVIHSNPVIYMRGVQAQQLNSMMELIYFGETKVSQDECEGVLKLLDEFQITSEQKGNKNKIQSIMCNFWNKGYCKEGNKCLFSHEAEDCHEHLKTGRCSDPWCKHRHRADCKHWSRGGCSKGHECQFLHQQCMNNSYSSRSRTKSYRSRSRSYSSSSSSRDSGEESS